MARSEETTDRSRAIFLSLLIVCGTVGTAVGTVPGAAESSTTDAPETDLLGELERTVDEAFSTTGTTLSGLIGPSSSEGVAARESWRGGSVAAMAADGTIGLDVHDETGSEADEINGIVIWQDRDWSDPYRELSDYSFYNVPEYFDLPGGHEYLFSIYINDQQAVSSSWISLGQYEYTSVDLTASNKQPLSVRAFYSDGSTPIEDATVRVKSHEADQSGDAAYTWREGETGSDGWVNPDDLWLQPPSGAGYYVVQVWKDGRKIGERQVDTLSSSRSISITTGKAVPQYDLTTDVNDGGGSISLSGEERAYEPGDTVRLEADPDQYYEFDEWEGDYPSGDRTDDTITIEMDEDKSVTADFDRMEADLHVDVRNGGDRRMDEVTGVIVWRNQNWDSPYREVHSPSGNIDLEQVFNNLPAGHEYSVTAYVQDQHAGSTGTFTIDDDADVSKTIHTETRNYLEVQARWADGDPIDDARVVVESHEGTAWRGLRTDAQGWTDKLWLYPPDGANSEAYYTVIIKKDGRTLRSVRVGDLPSNERLQINTRVEQPQHTLSLTAEGQGTVQASPPGRTVDGSTSVTLDEGTTVDLTASPDPGQVFAGWSGDVPSGQANDPTITVSMDRARSITATFEQGTGTATVDVVHQNGQQVAEANALVVWQDEVGGTPYRKIENYPGVSLAQAIEGLPAGHDYLVTAYVQDQYAGSTDWFSIQPSDRVSRTIQAADPVGVTVETRYADGETPLPGATVTVKSHEGYAWRSNVTGDDGTTIPLWLYPPEGGNYTVVVTKNGREIGRKTLDSLQDRVTVTTSVEDTRPRLDEINTDVLSVNGVEADADGVFDLSGGLVTSLTLELTDENGDPVTGIEPTLSYLDRIDYEVTEVEPGVYEFSHDVGRAGSTAFASFYLSLGYDGTNSEKEVSVPINDRSEPLPGPIEGWEVSIVQTVVVDGEPYTAVRLTEYPYVSNRPEQATYVIYDTDGNLVTDDALARKAAQTAVVDLLMSNEAMWEEFLADEYPSKMNKMLFWDTVNQVAIAVRDSSAQVLGTLASIATTGGATTVGGKAVSHMTTRQAMKVAAKEVAKKAAKGIASQYSKSELQANPLKVYQTVLRSSARSEMAASAAQAKTAGELIKDHPDGARWTYEDARVVWVATSESVTDGMLWSKIRVQTMPSGGAVDQLKSIGVNFIEGYTGQPAGLVGDYTEFAILVMTGELGSGVRTALEETASTRKKFHRKETTFKELAPATNDVVREAYGTNDEAATVQQPSKSASITVVEEATGSFEAGEWANTTVRVRNTGSEPQRFFVGYSTSTVANGTPVYYDNEGTTGRYVSVGAGESKTVDVAWQVQAGIPVDTKYDVIVAAWSERPGRGASRLDDDTVQDAFTVTAGGGVEVRDLSAPSTVTAGEPLTVTVAVENTAPSTESRLLNLTADGDTLERGIAYVDARNSTTLRLRHTFSEPGTYTLSVAGTSTTVTVEEAPESPVAALTSDDATVTAGDTVTLDATGSWDPDTDTSALTYDWTLVTAPDDATPSLPSGEVGEVMLDTPGTYTVRVTVSDSERRDEETVTVEVAAAADETANSPPRVSLNANRTDIDTGDAVSFDASESTDLDGDPLSYRWDIDGDGRYDDATGPRVATTFTDSTDSLVTVAVSDGTRTVTDSVVVTVDGPDGNERPSAALSANETTAAPDEAVAFDASASTDPDGDALSYRWDFNGDGEPDATGAAVAHAFDDPGTYAVTVTVSDGDTATTATESVVVEVADDPDEAEAVAASLDIEASGALAVDEPATIRATGDGPTGANATVTVRGPNGTTVYQQQLAASEALPATLSWRPTASLPAGTYTVELTVGADGETATDTASVVVDTGQPAPTIEGISHSGAANGGSAFLGDGELGVRGTATNATSVTVLLSAEFTSYRHTVTLNGDVATWNATLGTASIPDDGEYTVTVLARDAAGNLNSTGTTASLTVDRKPPVLSTAIEPSGNGTARVVVSSDEPLAAPPTVSLRRPDGSVETVNVTAADDTRWQATVRTVSSGAYHIRVTGRDRAGNRGHGAANAAVQTNIRLPDAGNATLYGEGGSFVDLRVNESVTDAYAAVTTSGAFANLSSSFVGVGFLTGELDPALSQELEHAVVGIPVNQTRLDRHNRTVDDVAIRYYNDSTGAWEPVGDTRVVTRSVDGTARRYFVANVTHFSTYGAVVVDETPPQLQSVTPDGETVASGTESITTTFDITDADSGVDPSSVKVSIDGVNVTDSTRTTITSDRVRYNATGDALGGSLTGEHTVSVVVVDEAGNAATYESTFTVSTDTTAPSVTGTTPTDDSVAPGPVTFRINATDAGTGLDAAATTASLNGEAVSPTVSDGAVTHTANLSTGTHTFSVTLVDEAGNSHTESVTVTVAAETTTDSSASSSGGGGGGGGGGSDSMLSISPIDTADGATLSVRDALAGTNGSAELGSAASGAGVTVVDVALSMQFDGGRFRVEVSDPASAPGAGQSDVSRGIAYVPIAAIGVESYTIESVTVRLHVDQEALPAGASPEDVVVYRHAAGGWQALETDSLGEGVYEVSADAVSPLAVGVQADETTPTPTTTSTPPATETATPVEDEQTGTTTGTDTAEQNSTQTTTPGFTPLQFVGAVVALALLLARRRT